MATVGNNIKQLLSKKYQCEYCEYYTDRKYNFDTHKLSAKHLLSTNGNNIKQQVSNIFECDKCNKVYKDRTGLWKHKKKCINKISNEELTPDLIIQIIKQNQDFKEIIIEQNKQNQDLQKQIIDVYKNGTSNIITNTNSHNKTFNLQLFLNETCKDAMNIMDFVDSIKIQLSDLEKVGKIGYIEGISSIIVQNLNSLDETKRPVHCTDSKREVMYVKDEDKWEKENENKQKIRKVIKHIAHKNSKMLNEYKQKYPNCDKSDSKHSDQYNKLVIEVMGGKGDNDLEKENKIIKNIAKEVTVDK